MAEAKTKTEYIFNLIRGVFITTAALCCAGVVFSFFAGFHLIFELSCHFYIQYFAFTSAAAVVLAFGRERKAALAMACFALYCAFELAPFLLYNSVSPAPAGAVSSSSAAAGKTFRAVCANVHTSNRAHEKVIALAAEYKPDFLILIEVNRRWVEAMKPLEADYPYRIAEPSEDNFGMAFYSRIKPVTGEIMTAGSLPIPFLRAKFTAGSKSFTLYGAHPLPPISPDYFRYRNDQLDSMAAAIAREGGPALLMGDLNMTPWSPYFKALKAAAGLRNSAEGRGLKPSWPAHMPPVMIPIDHCLNSAGVVIKKFEPGPRIGSDHLPLVADFAVE